MIVVSAVMATMLGAAPVGAVPANRHEQVRIQPDQVIAVPPESDPAFYDPPASVVAAKQPGEIIAARRVTIATYSVVPVPVDSWQLSFRSTDTRGKPIAAVTTVMKPKGPARGTRPLLSFQSATDGLARYCEPSYTYRFASVPNPITGSSAVGNELLQVQAALTQGWAVVASDIQGPKSAYAAGPLEGRIALDGIRAALRFGPMGLTPSTKIGMAGYSGGAIGTNWAAELLGSYAPELNVVGAAAGGSQPGLDATLNMANGQLTAGVVLAAVQGLSREYPELKSYLEQHVKPEARPLFAAKENLCLSWTTMLVPFLDNKALMSGGDPLRNPQVQKVIEATRLGRTVPRIPIYQYQSTWDWIAPLQQVDRMVAQYCKDPDARVTYTRDHVSEHVTLDVGATASWMMWMRDRFAGVPVAQGCQTRNVDSVLLDQKTWGVWAQIVGDTLAGQFGKPLGAGR